MYFLHLISVKIGGSKFIQPVHCVSLCIVCVNVYRIGTQYIIPYHTHTVSVYFVPCLKLALAYNSYSYLHISEAAWVRKWRYLD